MLYTTGPSSSTSSIIYPQLATREETGDRQPERKRRTTKKQTERYRVGHGIATASVVVVVVVVGPVRARDMAVGGGKKVADGARAGRPTLFCVCKVCDPPVFWTAVEPIG